MIALLLGGKLLLAYLLGSLSGSLLLGRLRGIDIRTRGSGNAGGTNALRTLGWAFALGTVLIDVGKGALAAALGLWPPAIDGVSPLAQALACSVACAIGHIWPVYFGFRGGKGAAAVVGSMAVCLPAVLLPVLAVWIVCLLGTGYVGLSTVLAALSLIPASWWLGEVEARPLLLGFSVVFALLLLFTHRSNITRLRAGTEHRFERVRVLGRLFDRSARRDA